MKLHLIRKLLLLVSLKVFEFLTINEYFKNFILKSKHYKIIILLKSICRTFCCENIELVLHNKNKTRSKTKFVRV